jgi:hypothetical protein
MGCDELILFPNGGGVEQVRPCGGSKLTRPDCSVGNGRVTGMFHFTVPETCMIPSSRSRSRGV